MNLVEVWFRLVERQAVRRGVFKSVPDLNAKLRSYIEGWHKRAHPFVWTKTAEENLKKANPFHNFKSAPPLCRIEHGGWQTAPMQSWRESTPQSVQDTFDELFSYAVDFAIRLLAKHKEFFPFGYHAMAGKVVLVGADPGLGEQPPSPAVLDALYEGSRVGRDDVDAVAFVSDVRLASGSDAVRVELEHRDGPSIQIVVPYRLTKFRRGVETGAISVSEGTRRIWA